LVGIGTTTLSYSLQKLLELLCFELNIFGIINVISTQLVAIAIILFFVVVTFKYLKKCLQNSKLTHNRLLVYSAIFFFSTLILQMLMPSAIEGLDPKNIEHYEHNIREIGRFAIISEVIYSVGYLLIIFLSIFFILRIGKQTNNNQISG